jgi:methyltransferase (TIGR00027 family)
MRTFRAALRRVANTTGPRSRMVSVVGWCRSHRARRRVGPWTPTGPVVPRCWFARVARLPMGVSPRADSRTLWRWRCSVVTSVLLCNGCVRVSRPRAGAPASSSRRCGPAPRSSALRTVAIDDAVTAHPVPQVVIIGAGLDDRAWRMPELADVEIFEVDHPASQRDKRGRVGDLQPVAKSVWFVPVDFTRDRLDTALESAGHRPGEPTTWIWEGVVPYLSRAEVAATLHAVSGRSTTGSRLVVNYQSPALSAALGRLAARAMTATARRRSPWADEPRRSSWTPTAMSVLFAGHGFVLNRDDDLLTLAEDPPVPVRRRRSLQTGRVAIADR